MGEELTAVKQKLYLDCMFHSACNDLNCLLVKYTSSLGVSGCGCWNTLSVTGARWVMYYKLHKQNLTLKTLRWDYSIYMHFRNLSAIIEYSLVSELWCMLVHACTNLFFKYWMISRHLKNRKKCKTERKSLAIKRTVWFKRCFWWHNSCYVILMKWETAFLPTFYTDCMTHCMELNTPDS